MKKTHVLATLIATTLSASAFAQSVGSLYGEVGYTEVKLEDTSATDNVGSFSPSAGRFTLGKVVANNIAVEGVVLQGLSSDSHVYKTVDVDVKLKTAYGVAVRPFVNLNDDLELFGRLGSMRVKASVSATAIASRASASEDNTSTHTFYGVGAAYKLNKDWKFVVDYSKMPEKSDMKATLFSVGARYSF